MSMKLLMETEKTNSELNPKLVLILNRFKELVDILVEYAHLYCKTSNSYDTCLWAERNSLYALLKRYFHVFVETRWDLYEIDENQLREFSKRIRRILDDALDRIYPSNFPPFP